MTEYADFDALLGPDAEDAGDVTLAGGRIVRVRGLSRYEWFLAGKKAPDGDANAFETVMISMGMVAPELSEKQVEKWRKQPGTMADLGKVSDAIRVLTGVDEGADKSDLREVRSESE
jgi:hypothetical protein